jgi:putative membrane protein insertion efficiency factor
MVARLLILLIRLYQVTLSRLLPPVCRFYPSCSRYGVACLEMHGALKGSHPFHPGGYDPPPLPEGHPALGSSEPDPEHAARSA